MGYFSNGTEGLDYQEHYCFRCLNYQDGGCEIWDAHLLYNGEEEQGKVLDMLIPIESIMKTYNGREIELSVNGECRLFRTRDAND